MIAYLKFIDFLTTEKLKGAPISNKFISNRNAILFNKNCVHHSHINGEIIGHAQKFCNEKVRENYYKIPVVTHTKDMVIGEKNPTNIDFAHISNQVQFIDTIKYFQ